MSDQPPSSPPSSGPLFCAECGAAMPADARFCGSCGAAPPGGAAPAADATTETGGASTWQGVAPVVERPGDATAAMPAAAGAAAAGAAATPTGGPPPGGPPPGGPPAGGPPDAAAKGRGKGPLIVIVLVVLAALIGGFLLLSGGDDDDDVAAGDDEEETTTTEDEDEDETTTTTEAPDETTATTADPAAVDQQFEQLVDDTGTIVVEVPVEWIDRSTVPNNAQPTIEASTSLATFRQDFTVPGMFYTVLATTPVDFNAAIDNMAALGNLDAACVPDERADYDDGVFVGRSQFFADCGGIGSTVLAISAANPAGVSVAVFVQVTEADPQEVIIDHIADTFNTTAG